MTLPETMKTIELNGSGGPEVLTIGKRDLPVPNENQVLVRTISAGVNGPDRLQRSGLYPPPSDATDLMGLELSGEIVSVGRNVTTWQTGDKICALTHGGAYAEYVAIDANHCLPIPKGVSEIDAGGICETFFTVWSNLFLDSADNQGKFLLVHGGAGGIGATAIQLGNAMGMKVFATCSNEHKAEFCRKMGADYGINYNTEDFVEVVRNEGGADLIVDIIGGSYIARNIKAAKIDGKIVQLAFNHGSKVEIDLMPIMLKRLTFAGSTLRARAPEFKARVAADIQKRVWPMFEQGKVWVPTFKVFSFDNVQSAHQLMEEKGHVGKILLTP